MKRINQYEPLIEEEEKRAVMEYLNSGGWLTEYKYTQEFERMIARQVGSKYASAVTNGTLSLAVALMVIGLERDAEVIVPDYTMISSANSVILAGAKPVLVDVTPDDLCLDLEKVEAAITAKTKAIMYVSINGRCSKMEELLALVHRHNLLLIEDASQSFCSKYRGKCLGTFGVLGCFSFSPPKIVTTGQGGAIVSDDEELYHKILLMKDYGRSKSGVDYYETIGYNFKFTDLQAVIGIEQMKKIGWRINRKKEMYKLYRDLLQDTPQIEFVETDLNDCTPWFMDLLVEKGREKLISFLNTMGIDTRPFYPAIHTQPPYANVKGDFENSEYISKSGLWLPSSLSLPDEDIRFVCQKIREYSKKGV